MKDTKNNVSQKEPSISLINLAINSINNNNQVELKKNVTQMITEFPQGSTSWLFSAIYQSLINELNKSEKDIKKVLKINPNYGEAHRVYSDILKRKHDRKNCLIHALKAVEINPNNGSAYDTLGTAYAFNNDQVNSEKCYLKAIELIPDSPIIYNNLGNTLRHLGKYDESITALYKANKLDPGIIEIYTNLALTLFQIEDYKEALDTLKKCENNNRNFNNNNLIDLYSTYGHLFLKIHQTKKAIKYYKKALKIDNNCSSANNGLGESYTNLRMYKEGLKYFKKSLINSPNTQNSISNYLLCYNYLTTYDKNKKYNETVKYSNYEKVSIIKANTSNKDVNKKLKIGFMSGDFYHHPVSYFLINFIESINLNRFETFAYSNNLNEDSFTNRLRNNFSNWRNICYLDYESVIDGVKKDQIDILFDLSGHTGKNSLKIFKSKVAPIQISWLGYSGTTGIKEIDYILCDKISIPKKDEKWYVEKPLRMSKSYYNFSKPLKDDVDIISGDIGEVTFGCFNNPKKLNDDVLLLWSNIIKNIPQSKIIFKYKYYQDIDIRNDILKYFIHNGINKSGIVFLNASEREDYLKDYNKIHISLDPFPYPGGTTTCESLYMGVPVITLKGNDFLSRNSENILLNSNLKKYIAKDKGDYMNIAINASQNIQNNYKNQIRDCFLNSPIMDGKGFTQELEIQLSEVWKTYCKEN